MTVSILKVAVILLVVNGCSSTPTENATAEKRRNSQSNAKTWLPYEGAWFKVTYPSQFDVHPSLVEDREQALYDSVFFVSPSKRVSFYVLSPQWRRAASDIALDPEREVVVSTSQQIKDGVAVTTRVIRARDDSHERLIETFVSKDQTVGWTFQFFYRDESAKSSYQDQYELFKMSLRQYVD